MNTMRSRVEGLVNESSTMHLKVLQHAAEISPLITNRTIGPDIEDYCCAAPNITERVPFELNETPKPAEKTPNKSNSPRILEDLSPAFNTSFETLDFETISTTLIIREAEKTRRRSIRKEIENLQNVVKSNNAQLQQTRHKYEEEREKRLQQQMQREKQIIEEARRQAQQQLLEEEREIAGLRQQSQHTLQVITVQAIVQYQKKFRSRYERVAKLLMSIDKQSLSAAEVYNQKLKSFVQTFDQLIGKIRSQQAGTDELRMAENLCKSISELEEAITKEARGQLQLKQQQQQQEQEKQIELQKKQLAQALQQQQEQQQREEAAAAAALATLAQNQQVDQTQLVSRDVPDVPPTAPIPAYDLSSLFVSKERFEFYTQINKYYTDKVEKVKPLQSDESMKKYRFACQKAINIPVNAISAVSAQHLQDKFEKLYSFICGDPLKTSDGQITINDHPLGRDYCVLLMAKKFVSQGDTAVSSNPQAAFPVASVIVSLWKLVPEFGQMFLAYTFKESPFLVPYFIPQKRGQTVEDYSKTLGYRINDGILESQDMYLKRQSGIARLYSAVMVTAGRRADGPHHPYGIENAWIWLANFISLHPLPDICATLMWEFIQNAGAELLTCYGKQFTKLLFVIQQQYFPKLSAVDEGGPKARLEILLGKILKEGQIQRPTGLLPSNFW